MDSYKLKDRDGDELEVTGSSNGDAAYVHSSSGHGLVSVRVEPGEALKVAMVLLEKAGLGGFGAEWYESQALANLREAVRVRAEKERRTLEDAEVERFRLHQLRKQGATDITPWVEETEMHQNLWRSEYLAAREFFEAPKAPELNRLEYGDDEPPRDTVWTSDYIAEGVGNPSSLHYDQERGGWTWGTCAATVRWDSLTRHLFPLERVSK